MQENLSGSSHWYLGLMTGTSFDGIDVALLKTDGESTLEFGAALTIPHPPERRRSLAGVMSQDAAPVELVNELTDAHADACRLLLSQSQLLATDVRAVGFHGQTILHAPEKGVTVQIGDGYRLAHSLGIPVVEQFRLADIAAGGEGAPLAPIFHRALLTDVPRPAAMVNIGGVANITWTDGERIIACDTGPGNAPLDDLMRQRCGLDFDRDGAMSASGTVDEDAVRECLNSPFFLRPPPKSLDRHGIDCARFVSHLKVEDSAATLAAITADGIVSILRHVPAPPVTWVITGGGRHNAAMIARLRGRLEVPVLTAEDAGWNGDAIEAYLFAYLAARKLHGLPSSFPETTGAAAPTICGRVVEIEGDRR